MFSQHPHGKLYRISTNAQSITYSAELTNTHTQNPNIKKKNKIRYDILRGNGGDDDDDNNNNNNNNNNTFTQFFIHFVSPSYFELEPD